MAASSPVPPLLRAADHDVEVTIISAKHLKNVNWRNGLLVPYTDVYIAPDLRYSTLPDDSNSTRPVWNERFLFPYSSFSTPNSILSVHVFHFHHSQNPKHLVGSLRVIAASLLPDFPSSPWIIHSLDLLRPSGRPQGKLRVKVTLRQREIVPSPSAPSSTPDYNLAPGAAYLYTPVSPDDYYPPSHPAHSFVRPLSPHLPRPPLSPPDYRAVPPPVRAYGNYLHDGNSDADSVNRPLAHFVDRPFSQPLPHPPQSPPDYRAVPPARAYGNYLHDGNSNADSVYRPSAHSFSRSFSQPLTCPPQFPPDYQVVPPPVRAYGNDLHDGNSAADSVYRPSAPVDFTYPAECEPFNSAQPDFHYTTVSSLGLPSGSHITRTLPHWSSNRSVLWRKGQNSMSLAHDRLFAPSAPTGTSANGCRRGLEEGSVAGAFERLKLDDGNDCTHE